jgi:hypothetical protein
MGGGKYNPEEFDCLEQLKLLKKLKKQLILLKLKGDK